MHQESGKQEGRGRLENKVAIVTGGASGFGRGIVELFASEGAKVVCADINEERAAEVVGHTRKSVVSVRCDVTNRNDVSAMMEVAAQNFGGLDILINNAGFTHKNQSLLTVPEDEFDRMYEINVKAIYLTTLASVPLFEKRGGGVIINTASTAALRPRPGLTWYNSSKGAVVVMTKSMAAELAPKNIRVNATCPVIGETGLLESFMGMPDTPENRQRFLSSIPLGRMSKPEDVANATLFLASDEAQFITGVALEVDGGRCI